MLLQVNLQQVNKEGNVSFYATAKINTGKSSKLSDVASECAEFCKGVIELNQECAKLGYTSATNNVKKSLPLSLTIKGLGKDNDVNCEIFFKNFGKFAYEATETKVKKAMEYKIEFVERFSQFA